MKDRELLIKRSFDAPREIVFEVWTDPEHIAQWWGPKGFTNTTREMDLRPGGVWRFVMHAPDGTNFDNRIIYTEIVKPERLAYIHDGDRDDDPQRFQVTIDFADRGETTELTMRMLFATPEALEAVKKFGAEERAYETLQKFEDFLSTVYSR